MIVKNITKLMRKDDGSTSVEFAMISTGFITLLFGVIELGMFAWTMNAVDYAVDNTLRYAVINETATATDIEQEMKDRLDDYHIPNTNIDINVTYQTISSIDFVEISGTYNYEAFVLGILPASISNQTIDFKARRPIYSYGE